MEEVSSNYKRLDIEISVVPALASVVISENI